MSQEKHLCKDLTVALKKYKDFESEHNIIELNNKLKQCKFEYETDSLVDLEKIPEVIDYLGEDYQKHKDVCHQLQQLHDELKEKIEACIYEDAQTFEVIYQTIENQCFIIENLIAKLYKLRSIWLPAAREACGCLECTSGDLNEDLLGRDVLEEYLKRVSSEKSLEELVQEYCSDWEGGEEQ